MTSYILEQHSDKKTTRGGLSDLFAAGVKEKKQA